MPRVVVAMRWQGAGIRAGRTATESGEGQQAGWQTSPPSSSGMRPLLAQTRTFPAELPSLLSTLWPSPALPCRQQPRRCHRCPTCSTRAPPGRTCRASMAAVTYSSWLYALSRSAARLQSVHARSPSGREVSDRVGQTGHCGRPSVQCAQELEKQRVSMSKMGIRSKAAAGGQVHESARALSWASQVPVCLAQSARQVMGPLANAPG